MKKKIINILGWIWYIFAIFFVVISFFLNFAICSGRAKKYLRGKKNYFFEQRYLWIDRLISHLFFIFRIKVVSNNLQFIPNTPCLIVFNHKSNLDGVVMVKLLIQNFKENNNNFKFNIIIKKQISKVSFLYNILSLIDALYIDRDDLRQQLNLFKKQNELIKEKHSIVIAPEGTRINEDEFGEFKSGAFKIAFDNMICVQPVVIWGTAGKFNKNKVNKKKGRYVYVDFLKPKKPFDFHTNNTEYFSEEIRRQMQNAYFAIQNKVKNKKEVF